MYIITLLVELLLYWYLLFMGCWWVRIKYLILQWWHSLIFQQHGVPYLQNHQGRKIIPTIHTVYYFLLLLNHYHILKHIPIIPFSDIISPIYFHIWILNLYRQNCFDSIYYLKSRAYRFFLYLRLYHQHKTKYLTPQ